MNEAQSSRHLILQFFCLLVPSWAIALLLLALFHLPRELTNVPAPEDAAIIAGGILLLGGALLVAWAEKAFYSEQAYKYGTMETLFASAMLRLERLIATFEHALAPNHVENMKEHLQDVQACLFALGKESLNENSEWLILHRARPFEPVMAG
jgi:hypothetical protein